MGLADREDKWEEREEGRITRTREKERDKPKTRSQPATSQPDIE